MENKQLEKVCQHFDNTLALFENAMGDIMSACASLDAHIVKLDKIYIIADRGRRQAQKIREQEGFCGKKNNH